MRGDEFIHRAGTTVLDQRLERSVGVPPEREPLHVGQPRGHGLRLRRCRRQQQGAQPLTRCVLLGLRCAEHAHRDAVLLCDQGGVTGDLPAADLAGDGLRQVPEGLGRPHHRRGTFGARSGARDLRFDRGANFFRRAARLLLRPSTVPRSSTAAKVIRRWSGNAPVSKSEGSIVHRPSRDSSRAIALTSGSERGVTEARAAAAKSGAGTTCLRRCFGKVLMRPSPARSASRVRASRNRRT